MYDAGASAEPVTVAIPGPRQEYVGVPAPFVDVVLMAKVPPVQITDGVAVNVSDGCGETVTDALCTGVLVQPGSL